MIILFFIGFLPTIKPFLYGGRIFPDYTFLLIIREILYFDNLFIVSVEYPLLIIL